MNSFAELLKQKRLGLKSENFKPCPVSLTPWVLPAEVVAEAVACAQALSGLLEKVAVDDDFLIESLADFSDSGSLLGQFKRLLGRRKDEASGDFKPASLPVNISRYDFLLTDRNDWRLVESNSIAAGMGPFSQKLGELYGQYRAGQGFATHLADNPAIEVQAKTLFSAAQKVCQLGLESRAPNLVFLVEENEDNVFDQAYLSDEIVRLGGQVMYLTWQSLAEGMENAPDSGKFHTLRHRNTPIDLIYYRTGYNLADYQFEHDPQDYLQLRDRIEQFQVAVCPSINHQLASSKWVQIKLAGLSLSQLENRFGLTASQALHCQKALAARYLNNQNWQQVHDLLASGKWLLKSQNEGGGNVFQALDSFSSSMALPADLFLMEKIDSTIRQEVTIFSKGVELTLDHVISELGIFCAGEQHVYAGYLLRSKPAQNLEAGVHGGHGFLDILAIQD